MTETQIDTQTQETEIPQIVREFHLVIFGGRTFNDFRLADQAFRELVGTLKESLHPKTDLIILSGKARGADSIGEMVAHRHKCVVLEYPAHWKLPDGGVDKGAGFARNIRMAQDADAGLAFHDGQSRGTAHMIRTMKQYNKPVRVIRY